MPELKLATVYIRVSTDDQTELSPDSQLEAVRAWAEKNGFYTGHTCLTLDMAYNNARLIACPNSEWLTP